MMLDVRREAYVAALGAAQSELSEIQGMFDGLRLQKERMERVMEALRPILDVGKLIAVPTPQPAPQPVPQAVPQPVAQPALQAVAAPAQAVASVAPSQPQPVSFSQPVEQADRAEVHRFLPAPAPEPAPAPAPMPVERNTGSFTTLFGHTRRMVEGH